ncbi:MAG: type III secretion system effector protein [Actinomycetota bacterium]|nr:type III secretion system effector protein [Actinomycetota bacterium]
MALPPSHCDDYRAAESRAVYALGDLPDASPRAVCGSLAGVAVTVVPAASMPCCYGVRASEGVILADDAPATTLPHELAHVADSARGISGHDSWASRGVWDAIGAAAAEPVDRAAQCSQSPVALTTGASGEG